MMTKSHTAGWASDAPTPAQIKEFFAQIASGRITKARLQSFLRNETAVIEVKGRATFAAFLDKELGALGLRHWYVGDEYGPGPHYITRLGPKNIMERILGYNNSKRAIASILAEPDSPSRELGTDAFRIRLFKPEYRAQMEKLLRRFTDSGFDVPTELVY